MNNSISIGCGKICVTYGMEECLGELREAGYEYLDFWLCAYCDKPDRPMHQDNWEEWVNSQKELFASYGIKTGQCHAYWRHKNEIGEDFSWNVPLEIFRRNFEACRILGTNRLVFHPLQRWMPVDSEAVHKKVLDINAEWFGSMVRFAEDTGVEIHIENLFDHKHKCAPNNPAFPCSTADDILYIIDKIGSPLVKTCLDTGHANIANQDIPAMIRKYGSRLGSLHLNDNYGLIGPIYEDVHLFPGFGRIEWPEVMRALAEVGYSDTLNMEVIGEMSRVPRAVRLDQLKVAKAAIEHFRDGI